MRLRSSMHCSVLLLIPGVLSLLWIGGCRSPYALEGKVIESSSPRIRFIDQKKRDPTLVAGYGIHGARIDVVRAPRSLSRQVVASGTTDSEGIFDVKIDEFEWKWLQEEWLFRCVHPDYPAIEFFDKLPPRNGNRVLVIELGPPGPSGSAGVPFDEDERIRRELERFGR